MIAVVMILMVTINNVNKRYLNKQINNKKINKPKAWWILTCLYYLHVFIALKTLHNVTFSSLFCSYLSMLFKSTSKCVIAAT